MEINLEKILFNIQNVEHLDRKKRAKKLYIIEDII